MQLIKTPRVVRFDFIKSDAGKKNIYIEFQFNKKKRVNSLSHFHRVIDNDCLATLVGRYRRSLYVVLYFKKNRKDI